MDTARSRPVTESDEPFLFSLFCSVRATALAPASLSATALEPLLRMQYAGQRRTYASAFPDAEHSILLSDGCPVGASYVSRNVDEIRLVDVALLPAQRDMGRGTKFICGLQDEGRDSGRPIRLSVDAGNVHARRLYARLGFEEVNCSATRIEMVWDVDSRLGL